MGTEKTSKGMKEQTVRAEKCRVCAVAMICSTHYCTVILDMLDYVKFLLKSAINVCAGFVYRLDLETDG